MTRRPALKGFSRDADWKRVDRRLPALGLVIAVALSLMLLASPASAKTPKGFFGIAVGNPIDTSDIGVMKASNVTTVRRPISWPVVQPKKGVYRWPDAMVGQLARQGIRMVPYLAGSPRWATHSHNTRKPPLKGKAKRAWKTFVKKAVKRYKPGGSFWKNNPGIPAKPVKQWQIWNEPNLKKEWPPKPSPKKYGKLLSISDKVIGHADRHAKVLLAGLSGTKSKKRAVKFSTFLKKLYKVKKVKKHFDAAALHPYAPKISLLKKRVKQTRKVMKKAHDGKTRLWLTELGYGSGPKDKYGLNKGSDDAQAKMLKKSFKLMAKSRKKWKIGQVDWFDWRDPANSHPVYCSFCPYAGLLNSNHSPKPALWEFRNFTGAPGPPPHSGGSITDLIPPLPLEPSG